MTQALTGNARAVRAYGIVITQTTLNQELLNIGIKGGVKAATELQKVTARMNLLMRGSADAIGDAERTSDSFANQVKGLKADILTLAETIGTQLIPTFKGWIKSLREVIPEVVKYVKENKELLLSQAALVTKILVALVILPKMIAAMKALVFIVGNLNKALGITKAALLAISANPIVAALTALGTAILFAVHELESANDALKKSEQNSSDAAHEWNNLKMSQKGLKGADSLENQTHFLKLVIEDMKKLIETQTQLAEKTGLPEKLEENITLLQKIQEEMAGVTEEVKIDTSAQDTLAAAIKKVTEELDEQIATFGLTADAIELWKLKQLGATEAELAAVVAKQKHIREAHEQKKLNDDIAAGISRLDKARSSEAESIRSGNETPEERLRRQLFRIKFLDSKTGGKKFAPGEAAIQAARTLAAFQSRQDSSTAASKSIEALTSSFNRVQTAALSPEKKAQQQTATNTATTAKEAKRAANTLSEIKRLTGELLGKNNGAIFN